MAACETAPFQRSQVLGGTAVPRRFRDSLGPNFISISQDNFRWASVSDKLPPLVDGSALPDFSGIFGDATLIYMMSRQACRRAIGANKNSLAACMTELVTPLGE